MRITAWPKPDQYSAVSWTTSPVTQVAEVAVNSASKKAAPCPSRVEMGRVSSSAPAKISSAKPIRMIRAGAMWFFLRMNTAIPLSVLSEAARGQQDHDNTDGPAGL